MKLFVHNDDGMIICGQDADPTPTGYTDKTTLLDVATNIKLSERVDYVVIRGWVNTLFLAKGTDIADAFSNCTTAEQQQVCKYILIDYATRVLFYTDAQDEENWDNLVERSKAYREVKIEKMRVRVSENLRKETYSRTDTTNFYKDTKLMIDGYIFDNDTELIDWISNKAGTIFENDTSPNVGGFAETSYYDSVLRDDLITIYNEA